MTKILKVDQDIQLRQLILDDAKDIFNTINTQREYLGKWLPFVEHTKDLKYSENFVNAVINQPQDKMEYTFTIRYHNQFAGIAGFRDSDKQNRKTEIGYWLAEQFQNKGLVTKSVATLCNFAFNELNMNRIQIRCATANKKSSAVPKRLGFVLEGVERDGELLTGNIFTDLEVYSKLKNE